MKNRDLKGIFRIAVFNLFDYLFNALSCDFVRAAFWPAVITFTCFGVKAISCLVLNFDSADGAIAATVRNRNFGICDTVNAVTCLSVSDAT